MATKRIGKTTVNKQAQRDAYEAFVRSGTSPVPASEVDRPLPDGSYRTSAANAGWAFWQAAQASLILGAGMAAAGSDVVQGGQR